MNIWVMTAVVLLAGLGWWGGPYWQTLAADALILMIFGISLQAMMALGGLVSFGHAAFFALGGYGAALAHSLWGASLPLALASLRGHPAGSERRRIRSLPGIRESLASRYRD